MVDLAARGGQIGDVLVLADILQRDHVNRADEPALMVRGGGWAGRQRARIDVKRAEPGQEIRQFDEFADLLVGAAGWRVLDALRPARRGNPRHKSGDYHHLPPNSSPFRSSGPAPRLSPSCGSATQMRKMMIVAGLVSL